MTYQEWLGFMQQYLQSVEKYSSIYSGQQIDTAIGKALNPDTTPTASSSALITSGAVKSALGSGGYSTVTRQDWTILPSGMQIVCGSYADTDDLAAGAYKDVNIVFDKAFNSDVFQSAQLTNRTWMMPENLALTVKTLRANNMDIRYKNVGGSAITDTIHIDWAVFGWTP